MSDASNKPVVGRVVLGPVTEAVQMPHGPIRIFQGYTYPHMCRDGHQEIGHRYSGNDERCPYCRAIDLLLWIRERPDCASFVKNVIDGWVSCDGIDRGGPSDSQSEGRNAG